MTPEAQYASVGDRGLLRTIAVARGTTALAKANREARALAHAIERARFEEVEEIVPGASSVLVVLLPGREPSVALERLLSGSVENPSQKESALHEIRVRYDGPDLEEVAALHALTPSELVTLHTQPEYVTGVVGFAPGFPYLIGLPEKLATARLATPRTRVVPGSVGIGGGFTGIYPSATPGGWRLIGHTEVELFDPLRDPPSLLTPGDRVRFIAI